MKIAEEISRYTRILPPPSYLQFKARSLRVHIRLGLVRQHGHGPLVERVVRHQPLALGQVLEDERSLIVPVQDDSVGGL